MAKTVTPEQRERWRQNKERRDQIFQEILRHQAEQQRQYEADCKVKVGRDATQPWHPLFNPSREELEQQDQDFLKSLARDRERRRTKSQEQHWREAVRLIRTGNIASFADLASRFELSEYDRQKTKRAHHSPEWAYKLVSKMVMHGLFSREQIAQLIKDPHSPFKKQGAVSTANKPNNQ